MEKTISVDRLSSYLHEAEGDTPKALELYKWNTQISAAFYPLLQGLEIALRNGLHHHLTILYNRTDWYEVCELNKVGGEKVKKAKEKVGKGHQCIKPPHVISELSFGFWVSFLNKEYHQRLWLKGLHNVFPNAHRPCKAIHNNLQHLLKLRNRIAHHEPIFKRHLAKDYIHVLETISWICENTSAWLVTHSSFEDVLSQRPLLRLKTA